MHMLRNLIFGVVTLAGLALASPVRADESSQHFGKSNDNSHHYFFRGGHYYGQRYYYRGPGFVYSSPYYNYDPYWKPPYSVYGYQPGFTIALGDFPWFHVHQNEK
jgi:hypothetical protein